MTGAEALVPVDEFRVVAALSLYETVAGEILEGTGRREERAVGMIHHYEVCVAAKIIVLPLLLGDQKGKDMVKQMHATGIEHKLVELGDAVSVLVDIYLLGAVHGMLCELVMIGEGYDVVT